MQPLLNYYEDVLLIFYFIVVILFHCYYFIGVLYYIRFWAIVAIIFITNMRTLANFFKEKNAFEGKLTSEVLASHRSLPRKLKTMIDKHPQDFINYIDGSSESSLS